jgi:hypothetical protein
MLGCACGRGELRLLKSGLKQEKLSVRPRYFLDCSQVFTRVWRVGVSGQIVTEPLLLELTQSSCMFLRLLFQTVVQAVVCKTDFRGVKNSNDSTEKNMTPQFFTCIAKLRTLSGL